MTDDRDLHDRIYRYVFGSRWTRGALLGTALLWAAVAWAVIS